MCIEIGWVQWNYINCVIQTTDSTAKIFHKWFAVAITRRQSIQSGSLCYPSFALCWASLSQNEWIIYVMAIQEKNTILKGDMQLHIPGLLDDGAVLRRSMGDDHTVGSSCEAIQPRWWEQRQWAWSASIIWSMSHPPASFDRWSHCI